MILRSCCEETRSGVKRIEGKRSEGKILGVE